jgi:hypothetical protein
MDITSWEPRISIYPGDIQIEQLNLNTYTIACNFIISDYNVPVSVNTTITKE